MSRPIGVTTIAILLLGSSVATVAPILTRHGGTKRHELLMASAFLGILAILAAEALWNLRRHAFLMFVLWALCSMLTMVLSRLTPWSPGHGIRLMGPIVYTGIACFVATLYLRRAL
jgi:hypothetical protein